MATHSGILAWRILWTEGPGGLQSVGSQSQTQLKRQHACTYFNTFFFFFSFKARLILGSSQSNVAVSCMGGHQ